MESACVAAFSDAYVDSLFVLTVAALALVEKLPTNKLEVTANVATILVSLFRVFPIKNFPFHFIITFCNRYIMYYTIFFNQYQ
jgi:hypothetical protein